MAGQFYRTLFGEHAREEQMRAGSRRHYALQEARDGLPDLLGAREAEFISARDSFYMATVSSEGWPYVQHRGGPAGFVRVLASNLLCFGELAGNRQFISLANLATNDRVAIFFMDYPSRRRLKLIGHARSVVPETVPDLVAQMDEMSERFMVIRVIGFDWNCPQHITPRFTATEVEMRMRALEHENTLLRAQIAHLEDQIL